jgi:hypothetical protein
VKAFTAAMPTGSPPSQFTFTDVTSATNSTLYTSNTITLSGMSGTLPVTITGGQYSKNGGAYTSVADTAVNGDTFAVQVTSSSSFSTAVNAALSVGSVSDTYTVTTAAASIGTPVEVGRGTAASGTSLVIASEVVIPVGATVFVISSAFNSANTNNSGDAKNGASYITGQYFSGGAARTTGLCGKTTVQVEIGDNFTINYSNGTGQKQAIIFYVMGMASAPLDTYAVQTNNSGGSTSVSLAGPLAQANELLIGYIYVQSGFSDTISVQDADYHFLTSVGLSGNSRLHVAYRIVGSTAGDTFANNLSASRTWYSGLLAFKGA